MLVDQDEAVAVTVDQPIDDRAIRSEAKADKGVVDRERGGEVEEPGLRRPVGRARRRLPLLAGGVGRLSAARQQSRRLGVRPQHVRLRGIRAARYGKKQRGS